MAQYVVRGVCQLNFNLHANRKDFLYVDISMCARTNGGGDFPKAGTQYIEPCELERDQRHRGDRPLNGGLCVEN